MAEIIPPKEDLLIRAVELYELIFNEKPTSAASAPGRVNLIGEHTDYNDGFVLPMALPMTTVVVGRKSNETNDILVYTDADVKKEPKVVKFHTPASSHLAPKKLKWANYVKGTVHFFKGKVPGFNAVIVSSVPLGGGVSSSASLEMAMYTFLEALTGKRTETIEEKALLCQKAEHKFANVPCGIMDQYISGLGKSDSALFLDCESGEYNFVPLARTDVVVLLTNSNVAHCLNSSTEYATRRTQCFAAAEALGVETLRKATMDMLEEKRHSLDDETFRRARHVITEIRRTELAAKALREGDYDKFGELMIESHYSLRDDYNVSTPELDQLVEIAIKCEGVYGSRLTGGGFGGCTVTLVNRSFAEATILALQEGYSGKATFFITKASDGAQEEDLVELLQTPTHAEHEEGKAL